MDYDENCILNFRGLSAVSGLRCYLLGFIFLEINDPIQLIYLFVLVIC